MTGMGHEGRFAPPSLNAGYEFRKETIAGTDGNERDAPKPAIRLSWVERVKPTQSGRPRWYRESAASADNRRYAFPLLNQLLTQNAPRRRCGFFPGLRRE